MLFWLLLSGCFPDFPPCLERSLSTVLAAVEVAAVEVAAVEVPAVEVAAADSLVIEEVVINGFYLSHPHVWLKTEGNIK